VPCPNTGLDAVKLKDGRVLMVYNHSFKSGLAGRGVLALAVSDDDGATWHSVGLCKLARNQLKERGQTTTGDPPPCSP
jgi:hypothetical protein